MLWGLLNKHWVIKGFVLVYIVGLIVVGSFYRRVFALTFDPIQNLSASVGGSAYPQIVASASNIYAVWQAQSLNKADIFFRRSTDAGLTWSPSLDQAPLIISANVTTDSIGPIVGASDSNVFVLWQDNTNSSAPYGGLLFRRSTDGGGSFVEPVQDLGATPYFAYINRQMVVIGSTVYVVWEDRASPFTPPQLLFRRSTDAGSTWDPPLGEPARVLSATSGETLLAMASSGQYVYVAGVGVDQSMVPAVFFHRSMDRGITFESAQKIASPSDFTPRQIVADGTNVYTIGLTEQSICTEEVIYRRSTDNGTTWDPPLNLSMIPGRSEAPRVYTNGATVYVVWLDRLDGTACDPGVNPFDILFRRSTDGGVTWDPPLDHPALSLSARIGSYEPPQMAVNGTNLYMTWADNLATRNPNEILFRHSLDGGKTWDPPLNQLALNLSSNSGDSIAPQIAVAGANTYIVWMDNTPGSLNIFFRRSAGAVGPMTLAEKAVTLAKAVIGAPYLGDGFTWGGKGWEWVERRYIEPAEVKTGYRFWNNKIRRQDSGAGLDCSGLILWSYNKAAGVNDYVPNEVPCSTPICYESADSQFKYNTQVVNGSVQRGDLMFFNFSMAGYNPQCLDSKNAIKCATHVAMYAGDNDVVQAPSPGGKIMLSSDFNILKQKVIPQGIRRIIPNPDIGFLARAGSPISLIVTDPDGFTISAETFIQTDEEYSREIPSNLYYVDAELGTDGKPNARVYAPNLKTGDYLIKPMPLPDAIPSDTYSLEVEAAGTISVLAQNISIRNIPSRGYGIRSTGTVISQFIPVAIDIQPGSSNNSINPNSKGNIPVAILSSTTFNAPREVNVASLSFGRIGNEPSLAFCNAGGEDVNGDGLPDLVCHFDNQTAAFRSGDTQGILKGNTVNTNPITGKDSVRIVP